MQLSATNPCVISNICEIILRRKTLYEPSAACLNDILRVSWGRTESIQINPLGAIPSAANFVGPQIQLGKQLANPVPATITHYL
jgi:hypothetical protein